jgi:hypothetical protein
MCLSEGQGGEMKIKLLMVVCVALLSKGCANTVKPMYDYGNYSESFYAMKLESGTETETEWLQSLERIIVKSDEINVRVPPGVYANLGYLSLRSNNNEKAISYFELEKATYPESVMFMDRLINRIKTQS